MENNHDKLQDVIAYTKRKFHDNLYRATVWHHVKPCDEFSSLQAGYFGGAAGAAQSILAHLTGDYESADELFLQIKGEAMADIEKAERSGEDIKDLLLHVGM